MELHIETILPERIAYVRQTGPYGPANMLAMEHLKAWAKEKGLLTGSAVILGIPRDNPETTPPEACRYDACIILTGEAAVGHALSEGRLPGGTYAVCTIPHTAAAIGEAWGAIPSALQSSGYRINPHLPVMERYAEELLRLHSCEICIPVLPL